MFAAVTSSPEEQKEPTLFTMTGHLSQLSPKALEDSTGGITELRDPVAGVLEEHAASSLTQRPRVPPSIPVEAGSVS